MKDYQCILFDWDGCLAMTLDIWLTTYQQLFAERNIFPSVETITQQVFGDWQGPAKIGVKDGEKFTEELLAIINQEYPSVQMYESAAEVLNQLNKQHKQLALLTSSKRSIVEPALKSNRLENIFDLIITAEDVEKHKPDPEIILKALDFFKANKSQTIIIGDSKSDLGAANAAGIDSVLFYPKHNEVFYDFEKLQAFNPTYIIKSFKEVLNIIS